MDHHRNHPSMHINIPSASVIPPPPASAGTRSRKRIATPYPVTEPKYSPNLLSHNVAPPDTIPEYPDERIAQPSTRSSNIETNALNPASLFKSPTAQELLHPILQYGHKFQQQGHEARYHHSAMRAKRESMEQRVGTQIPEYSTTPTPNRNGSSNTVGKLSQTSSRSSTQSDQSLDKVSVVDFASPRY